MFCAIVVLVFAVSAPLLFVAYCRSLLARASQIELSESVLKAMTIEGRTVSSEDLGRLQALIRLCPLREKNGASVVAVSAYTFLLKGLCATLSVLRKSAAGLLDRELRRCAHFFAVRLDQRIARARKLWADQMIHPGKEMES